MSAVYFDEHAFADKVMERISAEPTPSVAGAAVIALRQRSPRLLLGVSATAWHLATSRTASVHPQLRFKSAALLSVMLVTLAMGTTFAAAGAVAVVEQVAQGLPALSGPHRPNASHAANNGGAPPLASHDPGGKRADPSAAPAGAQPSAGVGEPHPSTAPSGEGSDGNGRGGDANGGGDPGKGEGDGNNSGGKGTHPDPTPVDDGHGDNHGGQTFGGGDTGKGDAGNGANGSDHSTGGQDSGNGSGANNGNNGTNGHD